MSKIAKIMCALSATFVLVSAPVEAASFGARGGFSGGRSSFSSRSFSAPRSYSAPRTYSAPRSYSAPRTTTRTIIRENHYRSSGGGFGSSFLGSMTGSYIGNMLFNNSHQQQGVQQSAPQPLGAQSAPDQPLDVQPQAQPLPPQEQQKANFGLLLLMGTSFGVLGLLGYWVLKGR